MRVQWHGRFRFGRAYLQPPCASCARQCSRPVAGHWKAVIAQWFHAVIALMVSQIKISHLASSLCHWGLRLLRRATLRWCGVQMQFSCQIFDPTMSRASLLRMTWKKRCFEEGWIFFFHVFNFPVLDWRRISQHHRLPSIIYCLLPSNDSQI